MPLFAWRTVLPVQTQHSNTAMSTTSSERWTDGKTAVEVLQPEGFLCTVRVRSKVNLGPDEVFDILVAPNNHEYFKAIKRVNYRKILEDNGWRQKVEVEQIGQWRFLTFKGEFATRLHVFQDKRARTVRFHLIKPGLMKDFAGQWTISHAPAGNQQTAMSLQQRSRTLADGHHSQQHWWSHVHWPDWQQLGHRHKQPACSLVTLEQSILPSMIPPPPVDRLLKSIACRQIRNILADLHSEVERQSKQRHGDMQQDRKSVV